MWMIFFALSRLGLSDVYLVREDAYTERNMDEVSRLPTITLAVDHLIKWLASIRWSMNQNIPIECLTEGSNLYLPSPCFGLRHVLKIDLKPVIFSIASS